MKRVKNSLIKAKNHVKDHKFNYLMGGVAIGAVALQQRNLNTFYAFLGEKGIDKLEFTCPEYYHELNNK